MDGQVIIGTELQTKSFEAEIKAVERKLNDMIADYETMSKEKGFDEQSHDAVELRKNIEKLTNELINLNQKQQELNQKNAFSGIGDSISGIIKKVGKWTIALFGIRSAYSFIRQSMSTLSQYNEQMATDIEYIRFAIATTLQPVIEYIIKLVYQLLGLINSIAKAWFGIDLFANASAKAFNKNAKAIGGASKNAKELQKTLAGFDEMNILQDDGSSAAGGGGGGVGAIAPSFDLSNMDDVDLDGVIKLLDRIKDLFNKGFDTIVGNVKKVLIDLGASPEFIEEWEKTMESIKQTFNGAIDFIVGLVKIIVGFLSGNTDLVVEGIKQAITGIKDFIVGLFNFILNIKTMTLVAIKDGLSALLNFVKQNVINPIGSWFMNLADNITSSISTGVKNINNWFNKIPEFLHGVKNRVVEIFKNIGTSVSEVVGSAFKAVINAVLERVETTLNKPISAINALIDTINTLPGINIGKLSNFKLPRLAKGGILNMPGQGVNYYGANIAEKGAEAVLPLTDSQQMDLLGASIARHMVVNLTNINQMNGRVISRELQRIQNNDDFAFNR